MNQLLTIVDDKLVVDRLQVKNSEGNLTHSGELVVLGSSIFAENVQLAKNVVVRGTLTVDTINAKNIITDNRSQGAIGSLDFAESTERDLDGKGVNFTHGATTEQLIYKEGGKLWSTLNIDLARGKAFCIDGLPVVSSDSLGQSIVRSNLRKVGTLKDLQVTGDVKLGDFAFFNPIHQRIGINTENPTGAVTIAENNVELVLSAYKVNVGYIGTYNNTDLELGTDNTARFTLKNTGEVIFGSETTKNAVVKINGRLEVDSIVTPNQQQENKSLVFDTKFPGQVFGGGIYWLNGAQRSYLTLSANPDKIISSENFDLAGERYYSIAGIPVLSRTSLGDSVSQSKLTSVGLLENLNVSGRATFNSDITVSGNEVILDRSGLEFTGANTTRYSSSKILVSSNFEIICDGETEFSLDRAGAIEIGNRGNTNKQISLYGRVGIGVRNPDSDVVLTVAGPAKINGKKFVKGSNIPAVGKFQVGDICWNTDPKATDYIGWVCVREGIPGEWLPFGQIASA